MAGPPRKTPDVPRVSAKDMRRKLAGDGGALLVCIYDQEEWEKSHLEGSISLDELERREAKLPRDTEVVFY